MEDNRNIEPIPTPDVLAEPAQLQLADDNVEEESEPVSRGVSKKWIIIGSLLVVFLAAAVFFGMRLINPQGAQGALGDRGGMFISSGGPGGGGKSVRLDMTPAKELPVEQPSTNGLFVRRDDQSIFIGTGQIQMMAKKSSDASNSKPEISSKYDGPVVEVVVTHQTKVYQDVTEMPEPDKAKDGVVTAQQVVKPGSLDDLGENMMITVWGEKQGDRFIASVIAFR